MQVVFAPVDPGCGCPDAGRRVDRAIPLNFIQPGVEFRPPGTGSATRVIVIRIIDACRIGIDAVVARPIVLLLLGYDEETSLLHIGRFKVHVEFGFRA